MRFRFIPTIWLLLLCALIGGARSNAAEFELREGGIIRGPKNKKQLALEFSADQFADGGKIILDELAKRGVKASFFFTGNYFTNSANRKLAQRLIKEGHYLGPHSDKHLLYCPWDEPKKTLVTKKVFTDDMNANIKKIEKLGVKRNTIKYWIPPYEHYNEEIVGWSRELGLTLINFSPGTRSTADYTENDAKNFVSSKVIYESILKKEEQDPNGLNGFLLLTHFGVSPKRTDKFYMHLGALLDELQQRGYEFVRVDEMLR